MKTSTAFPSSFPRETEEHFLKLLFCPPDDFFRRWKVWRAEVVFDDIDYATMRLMPLLYLKLVEMGVHDELVGRMKGIYCKVWVQNQLLLSAATRMLETLNPLGIEVVACKGIALLSDIYGDRGARFLGDGDFILAPERAREALRALSAAGWTYSGIPFPFKSDPCDALIALDYEVAFRDERGSELDIHWKLFPSSRAPGLSGNDSPMSYAEIRARAQRVELQDVSYFTCSREDLLLHVIVHGAVYNEHRPFRWVADALMTIRKGVDWQKFLQLTEKYGFEIEVQVATAYLMERFGLEMPKAVEVAISAWKPSTARIKDYYKKSDKPSLAPWGTFPLLFKAYWYFGVDDSRSIFGFVAYIFRAYNITTVSEGVRFVCNKLCKRLWNRA